MGIVFVDSTRFHGWKVSENVNGQTIQKEFSITGPGSVSADIWSEYQFALAQKYHARLLMRAALAKYLKFIRTNAPDTNPYTAVGIHHVFATITTKANHFYCGFRVKLKSSRRYRDFSITHHSPIKEAWKQAVEFWAAHYGVLPKHMRQIQATPPSAELFKQLRRHLNSQGAEIPTEALHDAYFEQREEIARRRRNGLLAGTKISTSEQDIVSWFQRESQKSNLTTP